MIDPVKILEHEHQRHRPGYDLERFAELADHALASGAEISRCSAACCSGRTSEGNWISQVGALAASVSTTSVRHVPRASWPSASRIG